MVEAGQGLPGTTRQADVGRHQLDGVRGGGGPLEGRFARRGVPVEDVVQGGRAPRRRGQPGVTSSAAVIRWSLGTTTTVVSVYSGIALKNVRSTGSRTKPASAPRARSTSGASAAGTWTRVSGMPGRRSFQTFAHLAGVLRERTRAGTTVNPPSLSPGQVTGRHRHPPPLSRRRPPQPVAGPRRRGGTGGPPSPVAGPRRRWPPARSSAVVGPRTRPIPLTS